MSIHDVSCVISNNAKRRIPAIRQDLDDMSKVLCGTRRFILKRLLESGSDVGVAEYAALKPRRRWYVLVVTISTSAAASHKPFNNETRPVEILIDTQYPYLLSTLYYVVGMVVLLVRASGRLHRSVVK
jgi:hypothetical protein